MACYGVVEKKKKRNCELQHTLEKRNIMRGRAVKLQIALTAGRAKTSAMLWLHQQSK